MKEFDTIGKQMPYKESSDYINTIIDRGMQMKRKKKSRIVPFLAGGIGAAAAMVIVIFSIFNFNFHTPYEKIKSSPTLSEVLSTLSDEQINELNTYTTDDIPEY